MLRTVSSPDNWDDYVVPVAVEQGGTGGHSAEESLVILNAIPASKIGKANGPIPLGPDGGIDPKYLGSSITGITGVDGDRYISVSETKEYIITTYDCFTNYQIEAISGTVTRKGNIITYTAGNRPGVSGFKINGRHVKITVGGDGVVTPSVISPLENSVNRPAALTIESSPFEVSGFGYTDTHISSDWQLSKSDNFNVLVKSSIGSTSNKTEWNVADLELETDYYVRVRYTAQKFGTTDWSPAIHFKTKNVLDSAVVLYPQIGMTDIGDQVTFTTAAYSPDTAAIKVPVYVAGVVTGEKEVTYSSSHESTDWQVSLVSSFSSIELSGHLDGPRLSHQILGLLSGKVYYLRVRHNHTYKTPISSDSSGAITYETTQKLGEWSDAIVFTTMPTFEAAAPTIIAPGAGTANHGPSTTAMASNYVSPVNDVHVSTDWEIALDSSFTQLVKTSYADVENKLSWTINELPAGAVYFMRVRYKGAKYTTGRWSLIIAFSTLPTFAPNQPVITSPVDGAIGLSSAFTVTSSAFSSPLNGSHVSTDWELSTDSDFTTVVQSSYENATNKTSWSIAGLSADTKYYVRARYNDSLGYKSQWTLLSSFNTLQTKPLKPSIAYPVENQVISAEYYVVQGNSFSYPGNSHANSDWEVCDSTTGLLVSSSYFDVTNKTSISLGKLTSENLKIRVRYRSGTGVSSDWSDYRTYQHIVVAS